VDITLLEDIFNKYRDVWFVGNTNHHKNDSYIRFMEIRSRNKKSYIKLFAYYPPTKKVSYFKLSNINHLSWLKIIRVDDELNSIFAKHLLLKNDELAENLRK